MTMILPKRLSAADRFGFLSGASRLTGKPVSVQSEGGPNQGDDEDDEEDKKNKKKKGKAEDQKNDEGDDDEQNEQDEDDEEDPKARAIRGRERGRILAIMNSPAGKRAPHIALGLALETAMPRKAAIGALDRIASRSSSGDLHNRMAGVQQPVIGAGGGEAPGLSNPSAFAAAIIMAGRKRRGEESGR